MQHQVSIQIRSNPNTHKHAGTPSIFYTSDILQTLRRTISWCCPIQVVLDLSFSLNEPCNYGSGRPRLKLVTCMSVCMVTQAYYIKSEIFKCGERSLILPLYACSRLAFTSVDLTHHIAADLFRANVRTRRLQGSPYRCYRHSQSK